MKIKSGTVNIAIERDDREVGSLSFNPEDTAFREGVCALLAEYEVKQKEISQRAEQLSREGSEDSFGAPANARRQVELLKETCSWLTGQIDLLFGEGTSSLVFGESANMYMIAQFFEGLAPYIEKASLNQVAKYTASKSRKKEKVMK